MTLRSSLVLLLTAASAFADVRLPAFFSDHAVLQRDKPLPVWGWAAPGEQVRVALGAQKSAATAGANGRWIVRLAAQPMSKEPLTLTVAGKNRIEIKDVLLGDVWLCSGQSNMTMPMSAFSKIPEYPDDLKAAEQPLIRQFGAKDVSAIEAQSDIEGTWAVSSAKSVGGFSAVGYHFARALHAQTGVPIGIVRAAKGSTVIEMWLSQETILTTPGIKPLGDKLRAAMTAWEEARKQAIAAGRKPDAADFPPHPLSEAGMLRPRFATRYNSMIAPFAGMALRGIVWYQAETNSLHPQLTAAYPAAQHALVNSWRKLFGDEALPFLYVQLPNYREVSNDPGVVENWALMRESQTKCLEIPNTYMAVTIDIGQAGDIHPSNKYDVGERLAALAMHHIYGKKEVVPGGPMFKAMSVKGGKATIAFTGLGGGLIVGLKEKRGPAIAQPGGKLQRFAIAGEDRKWVWADAVIEGDTVVVSSPQVAAPVAVRYAFASNPEGANLYNRAGLPAAPFRTDKW
ncbi:MAG: sialate O-acetylesterase [Chthoniobacter sp.]|jgi:sialate O-acetylesterase|nr:sialate O-acetylesterase [Chthoniobacter sp.]